MRDVERFSRCMFSGGQGGEDSIRLFHGHGSSYRFHLSGDNSRNRLLKLDFWQDGLCHGGCVTSGSRWLWQGESRWTDVGASTRAWVAPRSWHPPLPQPARTLCTWRRGSRGSSVSHRGSTLYDSQTRSAAGPLRSKASSTPAGIPPARGSAEHMQNSRLSPWQTCSSYNSCNFYLRLA